MKGVISLSKLGVTITRDVLQEVVFKISGFIGYQKCKVVGITRGRLLEILVSVLTCVDVIRSSHGCQNSEREAISVCYIPLLCAEGQSPVVLISLESYLVIQVTLVDEEGSVFIKWVDKTVSKVKPQELYKIDTEVTRLSLYYFLLSHFTACFKIVLGYNRGIQMKCRIIKDRRLLYESAERKECFLSIFSCFKTL